MRGAGLRIAGGGVIIRRARLSIGRAPLRIARARVTSGRAPCAGGRGRLYMCRARVTITSLQRSVVRRHCGSDGVGRLIARVGVCDGRAGCGCRRPGVTKVGASVHIARAAVSPGGGGMAIDRAGVTIDRAEVTIERVEVKIDRADVKIDRAEVKIDGAGAGAAGSDSTASGRESPSTALRRRGFRREPRRPGPPSGGLWCGAPAGC